MRAKQKVDGDICANDTFLCCGNGLLYGKLYLELLTETFGGMQ